LIVDFAPHSHEFLRSDHAHLRLGFRSDTVETWLEQSDLEVAAERTIAPPATEGSALLTEGLTVSLWLGRDRRDGRGRRDAATPAATLPATTDEEASS
ncbi:MAG TPA: hypothetical protein VHQ23_10155, partial [Ilumatobacteraceae bacterium]|nr:hypothetical protein [Ilumatobacteraceae bacterium]